MSRRPPWRDLRYWLAVILVLLIGRAMCGGDRHSKPVRLGTFNIENYPANNRQVRGAFDAIRELDVAALGVQEITNPAHFAAAAREHLGAGWRFAHTTTDGDQQLGVLFDSEALELVSTRVHPQTIVRRGSKPALEARMRRRDTGDVFRLIVVHLKAGGDSFDIRDRQLAALEALLADTDWSGEPVVLLGDFNATGDEDRARIAKLARATHTHWASERLECTSYWNRRDGCVGTALDHVVSSRRVLHIRARGPCESDGCKRRDRCPAFHREVSDHCPVVLELPER